MKITDKPLETVVTSRRLPGGIVIARDPRPPRPPRDPKAKSQLKSQLGDRVIREIASWHPTIAASVVIFIGLVVHEIAYAFADNAEYPLTILANNTRIFVMSHGGLDALGVGILVVGTMAAMDGANNFMIRNRA